MIKIDINTYSNRLSENILNAGVLPDILDALGFEYKARKDCYGTKYVGPCPIHNGDDPEHCVIYATDKIIWKCYSNGCHRKTITIKPSLIGFVRGCLSTQHGQDVGFRTAVQFIEQFTGHYKPGRIVRSVAASPAEIHQQHKQEEDQPPQSNVVSGLTREQFQEEYKLIIPSRYFERERGFGRTILTKMSIGYSQTERRVLCPIFSDDGEVIVEHMSRTQYPECSKCNHFHYPDRECWTGQRYRWKVPNESKLGQYLYGHHLALRSDSPYVVLTEGIADALRCLESGHPAVACFGLDLTTTQKDKLLALKRPIIVGFDNDPGGQIGAVRVVQELYSLDVYKLSIPADFKDLAEMSTREAGRLIDEHLAM